MSLRDELKEDSPAGQAKESARKRQQENDRSSNRPLNPDRDLSWDNTNFRDSDYD